jgi:hypothetical protein
MPQYGTVPCLWPECSLSCVNCSLNVPYIVSNVPWMFPELSQIFPEWCQLFLDWCQMCPDGCDSWRTAKWTPCGGRPSRIVSRRKSSPVFSDPPPVPICVLILWMQTKRLYLGQHSLDNKIWEKNSFVLWKKSIIVNMLNMPVIQNGFTLLRVLSVVIDRGILAQSN